MSYFFPRNVTCTLIGFPDKTHDTEIKHNYKMNSEVGSFRKIKINKISGKGHQSRTVVTNIKTRCDGIIINTTF